MKCPECDTTLHDVVDSRKRGNEIYRRRECFNGHRFSTLETVATLDTGRVIPRGNKKYPQELVDQCLAERATGDSHKVIADRHGVPLDTLNGWLSRGQRAPQTKEIKL